MYRTINVTSPINKPLFGNIFFLQSEGQSHVRVSRATLGQPRVVRGSGYVEDSPSEQHTRGASSLPELWGKSPDPAAESARCERVNPPVWRARAARPLG